MKFSKLYWQCRRGSLELDLLLKTYLENDYPNATPLKRQTFEQLLQLDDEDLLVEIHSFLKNK